MVHHTAPHIPFKASEEWNAAQAQLNGTVHCNYPRWYVINDAAIFCSLTTLSFNLNIFPLFLYFYRYNFLETYAGFDS